MSFPISLGSGATLASDLISGEHRQLIAPVTIANSPSVAQSGTWTVQPGNTANTTPWLVSTVSIVPPLPTGTNYIGLATVNVGNTPTVTIGSALPAGSNYIGLATVNVGNNPILGAGTNNIGDVDVLTLPALPTGANYIGLATVNVGNTPTVTVGSALPAGANYIGLVSVSGSLAISSGATVNVMNFPSTTQLAAGSAFIGLATVVIGAGTLTGADGSILDGAETTIKASVLSTASGNPISVRQLTPLPAGANYIGLVSVSGSLAISSGATVNVLNFPATQNVAVTAALPTGANYIGLATVTIGAGGAGDGSILDGAVTSIKASVLSTASGNPILTSMLHPLPVGPNFIGLVSAASIHGKVDVVAALPAGTNNIGDVDVLSIAAGSNYIGLASVNIGGTLPALTAGSAYIGLASVNIGGTLPALTAGSAYIGLASVNIGGTLPALTAGSAYIGLASVNIGGTLPALAVGSNSIGYATTYTVPISTYTSMATIASAAGAVTLSVPPTGQRWVLKDLIIGSLGRNEVSILSGATIVIPYIALATTGGYISNFGDSGIRGKAVNDALVFQLNSAATVSIMTNLRFE